MNISVIIPYSKRAGGAYNYILAFIDALIKIEAVDNINLICTNDALSSIRSRFGDVNNISIYGYKENSLYIRKFLDLFGYAPKLNKKLLDILDCIQSDIFITTAPWNEGIHYWSGRRVVIVHDLFSWPSGESKLEFLSSERDRGRKTLEMLAFANYVVCESIFTEERIKEARRVYNLNNTEIFVASLPPGFRPTLACPKFLKRINGLSYWFIPSHIAPLKNQEVIVNALIRLKKIGQYPNVVFSFPSFTAAYMLKLLIKIISNGLWGQIFFIYKASSDEMQSLYQNCLGVILTTKIGPTNMPALEAVEFNKHCVATYESVCGYGEEYGIVKFESSDDLALSEIINKINSDDSNIVRNSSLLPSFKFQRNIENLISKITQQVS